MDASQRTVTALAAAVLLLAGCGGTNAGAPGTVGRCEIVSNGTPAPKSSPGPASGPEVATGYRREMSAVHTAHFAVATANPLATQAACRVLRDGGSAADALVTAQAVLGLVEPQASGVGGGGFLLYYDARSRTVTAYDGREVAPAAATENYLRWIDDANRAAPQPDARASGRSIGVPGIVRMLGGGPQRVWPEPVARLVQPRGQIGRPRFRHQSPAGQCDRRTPRPNCRRDPEAGAYFLDPDGSPKTAGTHLTSSAYAKTLGAIASDGAQAFYTGDIARDIVAAATDTTGGRTPSLMTLGRPSWLHRQDPRAAVHRLPWPARSAACRRRRQAASRWRRP